MSSPKTILVIASQADWYALMRGATLADGSPIKVEQTLWRYLHCEASSFPNGPQLHCFCKYTFLPLDPTYTSANSNPFPFSSQKEDRDVIPDFLLFRNFPNALHGLDCRPSSPLYAQSHCLDRPLVQAMVFSRIAGVNTPMSGSLLTKLHRAF